MRYLSSSHALGFVRSVIVRDVFLYYAGPAFLEPSITEVFYVCTCTYLHVYKCNFLTFIALCHFLSCYGPQHVEFHRVHYMLNILLLTNKY
uniref:Uncharacterized protein n=1 Tax=Rhipicephalus zambeziensis TaxID=60191 RepID=A0A224YKK0_9ACAR